MSDKSATASARMSTNAGQLLDQLVAAINRPVATDLDGAVFAVDTAFARRSIDAHIRSPDEIRFDLDRAKRQAIKYDLDGDAEGHKTAAAQVVALERELADLDVKRQALRELQEERRTVVDAANVTLGEQLSTYRHEVGESAKALEVEALRLWSIAAAARKVTETTESRFDQFGMFPKTASMKEAIEATRSLFPTAWSSAMTLWWKVHGWVCRP